MIAALHVVTVSIIITVGSLFHNLYWYTKNNSLIGTVAATDESIASHQKMGLWPLIVGLLIVKVVSPPDVRSLTIILIGAAVYWSIVPIMHYVPKTFANNLNYSFLPWDIFTFFVAISAGYSFAVLSTWPQPAPLADVIIFVGAVIFLFIGVGYYATFDNGPRGHAFRKCHIEEDCNGNNYNCIESDKSEFNYLAGKFCFKRCDLASCDGFDYCFNNICYPRCETDSDCQIHLAQTKDGEKLKCVSDGSANKFCSPH